MESKDPRRARQTRLRAHRARAPSSSSALPALVGGGVEPDTGDPACGFDDRLVAPSVEQLHGPVRRLAIGASGAGLEEPCGRPGAAICARYVAAARAFFGRTCAAGNRHPGRDDARWLHRLAHRPRQTLGKVAPVSATPARPTRYPRARTAVA